MLDAITPIILTYNEAPNIARTVQRLSWAKDVIIVDSFSNDETLSIVSRYPHVRVIQRKFDNHASQWNFALKETGIKTEWVLALDADYILSDELIEEIKKESPRDGTCGYEARFKYCVNSKILRSTVYPPVIVLYRHAAAKYVQDGHTQRVTIDGVREKLHAPIFHDDRKPLSAWVKAQMKYMRLEAEKLSKTEYRRLGWADRVRLLRVVAPFGMLLYCLFFKGVILDGKAGIYYSFQRMFAELLLSLFLLARDIGFDVGPIPQTQEKHDHSGS